MQKEEDDRALRGVADYHAYLTKRGLKIPGQWTTTEGCLNRFLLTGEV
jgi:hypothetical protein